MFHATALGGAKNLGQKALFLAAGAVFAPKKAQNVPKLAKIYIFLKSEQIFLASEFFSVGFFAKMILDISLVYLWGLVYQVSSFWDTQGPFP